VKVDWPTFSVGWPPEGSLHKTVANEAYRVIVGMPGHIDQFPYIDYWQDAVLSWPTWLRPCMEDAYRITVARVATTSKCREQTKEPILVEEHKEIPYVPLYPPLPLAPISTPSLPTLDRETQGTVTPVKSGPEASGASTPLTSVSPMDLMPTLSPPVLTSHPPFNQGHPTSPCEDPSSPETPTTLQMVLRKVQGPVCIRTSTVK
jgi:hypothetical protein